MLGYGPALVADARGRRLVAGMQLDGRRVSLTVPGDWLAAAEFPVVVDPVIGPAALVSDLQGQAEDPAMASDGSGFLSVWGWNGDVYARLVDAGGALTGTLVVASQADGVQHDPAVTYNPASGEYLVVWDDRRYGWTYSSIYGQRVGADGQLLGDEIEIRSPALDAGYPAVAASDAGDYLVAWHDNAGGSYDIHAQRLAAGGALSGTLVTLSSASGAQVYPVLAYDSQQDVFLAAWADYRGGTSYDIYAQREAADGTPLGSNLAIATEASKNLRRPAVAANAAGQFLVAWQREYSGSDYDVHAQRVAAGDGQLLGGALAIDTAGGIEGYPAPAGSSGGEYLLAWQDDGVIQARRVAGDGTLPGSVVDLSAATSGWRQDVAVAHAAGGGQSLAAWEDGSQAGQYLITGRRVADAGTTSGDEVFISPYFSRRERTAMAFNPGAGESHGDAGLFWLAWQQAPAAPAEDVFVQRADAQGQPAGDPANVTDHPAAQARPDLAAGAGGAALAVWQDARNEGTTGSDVYGQLLDAGGVPSGTLIALSTAAEGQYNPAAAYNSARDEYLVMWTDYRNTSNVDVYGQLVDADGTLLLTTPISLTAASYQGWVDVAYDPDRDRYLAVWEDLRNGGAADVYGQVISADGSLQGTALAITTAGGHQYDPAVAYDAANQAYLVAWWDNRDGVQWDIYGQVISGDGTLSGANFAISSPGGSGNDQEYPAVAAGPAGEFLVVWHDRRGGWARDVYAQRVSAGGALLDEPDTPADETDPTVNIPLDTSSAYTEYPAVAYSPGAAVYLAAWNERDDGGVYARRYVGVVPPTPSAAFSAAPLSGVVPLTVVFTDTSTGTIATREWSFGDGQTLSGAGSAPISHTYVATGAFTVVLTAGNPGGWDTASAAITVTEQTTPCLAADFEDLDLGADPAFWLDQNWDATAIRDDFETLWAGDGRAYGAGSVGSSVVYSHYAIPGWAAWEDYEFRGRMLLGYGGDGIGLSLYSRFPAGQGRAYVLRRFLGTAEEESFHLFAYGAALEGDLQTDVTPAAGTWYRFRVQAVTRPDRVTLRARVWPEGSAEPATWQAEAYDAGATRITAGAAGVRAYGAGDRPASPWDKYFDDLAVAPLAVQADFTAAPREGYAPLAVSFEDGSLGQVTTYTWGFGDGSAPIVTGAPTATHRYGNPGVYTASLSVEGPAGADVLTRTAYITALDGALLSQGLQGHWRLEEASGTRADSSPNANHLAETNTVGSAAGQVGQAADLERDSSEYLSIGHAAQQGLATNR